MASVSKREWTYKGKVKEAWIVRYFDDKGAHKQKTFALKKAADAFRRKIEDEIGDGMLVSESLSVKEICDRFLKFTEDRVRDGQVGAGFYKNVRGAIDHSIIPRIGRRVAKDLTALQVEDWFRDLCREPSIGQPWLTKKKPRPLKPRTARARVAFLSSVFDWATRREWLKRNVCLAALKEIGGVNGDPIKTFTEDEIGRLLKAVDARARGQHGRSWLMTRCIVHIALFCGLRFGEILALRLAHVKLDARVIEVRHSLTEGDKLKGPKTKAGIRDVPMPIHLRDMLAGWIRTQYRNNPRELIFRGGQRTRDAGIIYGASFRSAHWMPLLKRAGLYDAVNPFHFHALRHFNSSCLIDENVPITIVAGLLGHSKFDTTLQIYAHPIVNGQRTSAAAERMSQRFNPAAATLAFASDTQRALSS